MTIIEKIRDRLRITTNSLDFEIEDLIGACKKELEVGGVYGEESDDLYFQAIVIYCKANFGYSDNSEKFSRLFYALRDAMALSGDYEKVRSSV